MNGDQGIGLFNLHGRVALVTGGSKGLGLSMAEGLASAGATIVIVNRNKDEGVEAAKKIKNMFGVDVVALQADVSDEGQVNAMIKNAVEHFGQIDILINNAGISARGPIDQMALADFQQVLDVNVTGVWLCTKAVVPYMKKRQRGRIINIGSTLSIVGYPERSPYTASKGAVTQMTKGLALELAPWNITVNAICPGPFLTEMSKSSAKDPAVNDMIISSTALGRWGDLIEIQGIAIYLASDASSYMTGALMSVDGGWVAK